MLLDGGGADLVGGPTYLGGSGGMIHQELLYLHALKSILVHSETSLIGIMLKMDP